MRRSQLREQIFQLLFRVEYFPPEAMQEQEGLFVKLRSEPLSDRDEQYIRSKFEQILDHLPEIDAQINEKTDGWSTDRFAKTDLAVVRLAVYEIIYDETVPTGAAINEAVELARKYGQDSSPSFVNGVLARFA